MRRVPLIVCVALGRIAGADAPPPVPEAEQRHAAEAVCAAHEPTCDWVATFSSLERQSIARSLASRGLEVEPQPWGKVIEHVVVVNEDVFAEDNWLQFFNIFHVTTREHRIRQELTIQAGEVWDQERIEESARRLHDPLYTSVVALLPVKSSTPGHVDLLVVTRDIWSLRLNTQYTFQQGDLTNLSFSLSENNFLGERDVLAAAVVMDQGAIAVGPLFIDKDFLGRHLNLNVRVNEILTRRAPLIFDPTLGSFVRVPGDPGGLQDDGVLHSEGESATASLSYPLWSLATEWGGGVGFAQSNAVSRRFTGAPPDPTNFPNVHGNTAALLLDRGTGLPREYRMRSWSVNPYVQRQWGKRYKQRLEVGYVVSSQRPSLLPSFAGDAAQAEQFAADVFPHSEVISQPYVKFSVFETTYRTLRNQQTYDLAEDLQLGPSATVSFSQALQALGSDHTFSRPGANLGWTFPWCRDGYVTPSASISWRLQHDDAVPHGWYSIDNTAGMSVRAVTPQFKYGRIVSELDLNWVWHDTQNSLFSIGSESGLRGYALSQFLIAGDGARSSAIVEARSVPVPWWVFRIGAVAFWEGAKLFDGGPERDHRGGTIACPLDCQTKLYQDVGFGLRLLIPQTSRELFRFDVAFPLVSAPGDPHLFGIAKLPGNFIAAFDSYF